MRTKSIFSKGQRTSPLAGDALTAATIASLVIAGAALLGGAVRLLPWLFDPAVPWRVAAPFARGLASIAIEAAVLVGWPVGWTLAAVRMSESGEARALQALGEPPRTTVLRLFPQALAFAAVLAALALVWGKDASEPGRVATELVAQARTSCAKARAPTTYAIPFTELTWLCAPSQAPRLTGTAPGFGSTAFTAAGATIAGDFRAIKLTDARLALSRGDAVTAHVHVGELALRGLAPWSHASTLSPAMRAIVMALSGALAASMSTIAALAGAVRGRASAIAVGAVGPLAALGVLRALERLDARPALFVLTPIAAALAAMLAAAAVSRVSRLMGTRR